MATHPRPEAAASTTGIASAIETDAAVTAAEMATETETETAAIAAEIVAPVATETRPAGGIPRGVRPEATRVGVGAGAVILADTHVVIEPTETTTVEATAVAVAALAPARPIATTARPEKTVATATIAGIAAAKKNTVPPETALPAILHRPETSAIAALSSSSSWPLASVPAS
jgi:hypothetical protein